MRTDPTIDIDLGRMPAAKRSATKTNAKPPPTRTKKTSVNLGLPFRCLSVHPDAAAPVSHRLRV